ncbi:MAG TPA: D-glycero-beta-D-manno-heptose 1,7-bisphosphate 7-phosphatase [Gammaproteobacteria bacterium]|jgi:D-glycero-D-manno-heptose 1,7-bisphosphate phosphatase|nr:D-glycero-beta-D-manno-heptose 1,7-bisphosphate 7-phosphatase [Gammaproteobacteria bacterium]
MKLVILDRDGVINQESDAYIKSPEEWFSLPGSLEAIARLHKNGYTVVVASNQSGVGRGYFTLDTLAAIHGRLRREVEAAGGKIDGIFFCPHRPEDNCDCRKPKTGLFKQISERYKVDLRGVPMIGDTARDIIAARAMGCRPILVLTGRGHQALEALPDVEHYADLAAAVTQLMAEIH